MIDGQDRMAVVSEESLNRLGLTAEQAFERALINLPARLGELSVAHEMGLEIVSADSGLATGALLLPDACRSGGSENLVLVSARNTYFSVNSRDKVAVETFWTLANGLRSDGASLSQTVLSCRSGRWNVADEPR